MRGAPQRALVLGAAAAVLAGVFVLRVLIDDPADGGALLFAPAVAMIAMELGLLGGLAGAALAFGLFVGSTRVTGESLGALALGGRALAFAVLAAIVGYLAARRQAAVERERKATASLREAQAIGRVGSWEWDVAADRVTWSDELYRIYGLDPAAFEATYGAFLERIHPDDRDRVAAVVTAAVSEPAPFSFDHRVIRPDGSVRVLHGRGEVYVDDAGKLVRMAGTALDVTELRATEERLARAATEVERREVQVRQARELNDAIVQGLVLARYALAAGDDGRASELVGELLHESRRMVEDLLAGEELRPGDLRRRTPARS